MFFLSNYLDRAYHGLLVPLLGFIFLPVTTLAYAWLVNSHMPLDGVNLIILIVAVIIDVGGLGGGEWHRRQRYFEFAVAPDQRTKLQPRLDICTHAITSLFRPRRMDRRI